MSRVTARIMSSLVPLVAPRTRSASRGPAFSGEPASKGGWGSYSIASWAIFATSSPNIRARTTRPKSKPAVTPPPVIRFPSTTTRSLTFSAPNNPNTSRPVQCVAARRPRSSPAAPRINEPPQTAVR
nr:hypothetical protein [Actinokineospora spheciospongiae]